MADMTLKEALQWADFAKRRQASDYSAEACAVLAAEVRKHQWIPVGERLPEDEGRYLI